MSDKIDDEELKTQITKIVQEQLSDKMCDLVREPYKPACGDDVLDFVKRRVRELTKEEIKEREKQHKSITLTHKDIYKAYIADGLTHDYAYIPSNDCLRSAMAYAMAKAYGVVEERNVMCDLFMDGYKGFTLCEE